MRTAIIVLTIVLAIIYFGGVVKVGGVPLFYKVDTALHTRLFMKIHFTVFGILYRGAVTVQDGMDAAESDIGRFGKKPLGIDNPEKHRKLMEAGQ